MAEITFVFLGIVAVWFLIGAFGGYDDMILRQVEISRVTGKRLPISLMILIWMRGNME